jgi:uncharacterized protein (TIGR02172 family)
MNDFTAKKENETGIIRLGGRIDSFNAPEAQKRILELCTEEQEEIILDCADLAYIASSGLRILLILNKEYGSVKLIHVNPVVYDVLTMSGFEHIMSVEKAYRVISLDGLEVIGEGANGIVYRMDPETAVKVFKRKDALAELDRERILARKALIMGIPTAISYDTVMTDDGRYGAVYELVASKSCAKLIRQGEKTVEEIAEMSVDLLRTIHAAVPEKGLLPSMKQTALERCEEIRPYLSERDCARLREFIESIEDSDHLLHGDFHVKNVHAAHGESILIDMATLCTGDPLFELAGVWYTNRSFADLDPDNAIGFLGIEPQDAFALCDRIIEQYYDDPEVYLSRIDRIRLIAYCRLLRFTAKSKHYDPDFRERQILHAKKMITLYLDKICAKENEQ